MFILGFIVGIVVGFFIAVLVISLCMAAKDDTYRDEEGVKHELLK